MLIVNCPSMPTGAEGVVVVAAAVEVVVVVGGGERSS